MIKCYINLWIFIFFLNFFFCRSIEGSDVDSLLFDRLGRFLKTHTIKVDLKGTDILGVVESAGRSLEEISDMTTVEGRGKKSEYKNNYS